MHSNSISGLEKNFPTDLYAVWCVLNQTAFSITSRLTLKTNICFLEMLKLVLFMNLGELFNCHIPTFLTHKDEFLALGPK